MRLDKGQFMRSEINRDDLALLFLTVCTTPLLIGLVECFSRNSTLLENQNYSQYNAGDELVTSSPKSMVEVARSWHLCAAPRPVCLPRKGDEDSVGQCPRVSSAVADAVTAGSAGAGAALSGELAQLADVGADPGLLLLGVTAKQAAVVSEQSCAAPKLGGELPVAFSVEDVVSDQDGSQALGCSSWAAGSPLPALWVSMGLSRAVFQGSHKHWVFVLVFLLVGGREEEQFAFLLQDQLQVSFLQASRL